MGKVQFFMLPIELQGSVTPALMQAWLAASNYQVTVACKDTWQCELVAHFIIISEKFKHNYVPLK